MKNIGVFCGTFNPIHWGHLLMAELAVEQFQLEKVLFITSASPPHRSDDLLEAEERHKLVEAAIASNAHFEASRIELDRSGPSYTTDTVKFLHKQYGENTKLHLIVGEDNLEYLPEWHEANVLFKLCNILIAPRTCENNNNHCSPQKAKIELPPEATIEQINFHELPVSSTLIRQRLRNNQSVLYLVPPKVNDLLIKNKYYLK